MAYTKQPKSVSDYAVGYQSVNELIANCESVRDVFDLRHGIARQNPSTPLAKPWTLEGRHDDVLIPRAVMQYDILGAGSSIYVVSQTASAVLLPPIRNSAGKYEIPVRSMGTCRAKVTAQLVAAFTGFATCYVSQSPVLSVFVSTWLLNAGEFVPFDIGFSLAVWESNP